MDLLDFEAQSLYFEDELPAEVGELLDRAAELYGEQGAEHCLLQAYFLEPDHLTVLVALYRYYYYQHRLDRALLVAGRAMAVAARRLGLSRSWRELDIHSLGQGVLRSMTLVRFYLMALKGSGYLMLRMGDTDGGLERLEKVAELDVDDRMGVAALIEIARAEQRRRKFAKHPNIVSI